MNFYWKKFVYWSASAEIPIARKSGISGATWFGGSKVLALPGCPGWAPSFLSVRDADAFGRCGSVEGRVEKLRELVRSFAEILGKDRLRNSVYALHDY